MGPKNWPYSRGGRINEGFYKKIFNRFARRPKYSGRNNEVTVRRGSTVLEIYRAVNPPRLQILRIDGEWVIDYVIMQDVIFWEENARKRCFFNCNI